MTGQAREVRTSSAPMPIGPYSQAVVIGDLLLCSGQLGIDPVTGRLEEGLRAQTDRSIRNITAILEEAGTTLSNVVRCTVYLSDMNSFRDFNEVYATHFRDAPAPSRVVVGVASLPLGAMVEIEVMVAL